MPSRLAWSPFYSGHTLSKLRNILSIFFDGMSCAVAVDSSSTAAMARKLEKRSEA
jgi:hypothetical protein